MIENLSKPEYVHVLLNPLPVYGLAVGTLALINCARFEIEGSSRNRAGACDGERCFSVPGLLLRGSGVRSCENNG